MASMAGSGVSLGTLWVNIAANIDDAVQDLQRFGNEVGHAIDEQKSKWEGLASVGQSLSGIGAGLTLVTAPFVALAAASVKSAGDLEALRNALTTVTGSSEETARQMTRLKEIAKLPGLGLEEAVKGSLALQTIGIEAQTAERYLKAFGNAIAAAGGGKADLEAVVVQLRQMGSTGKVTAEDLRPILERVPQVAAVTKEAFGTIDTEALQKAGVSSEQFLSTIVAGLEKIPPVTGGIKNSLENMADATKESLAKVGNAFVPVLNAVTPLITTFLEKIGELATWFSNLPAPVQAFIGTLAGMAAALGPVLLIAGQLASALAALGPAIGGIAEVLGVSSLALGGWAVAIAAAVAALVALGVWVYQNWDAIVAVLTQAWEGLKETWTAFSSWVAGWFAPIWNALVAVWHAIMDPYFAFLAAVWGPVITAFQYAWNAIKGFLETVWNGIKSTAETVWNAITGAIQKFLSWAEKIPGVNKLFNLDDAWKSAQKLGEETKKAGEAAKTATPQIKTATSALKKHGDESATATEETRKLATATKQFVPPAQSLGESLDLLYKKTKPATEELHNLAEKAAESTKKALEMQMPVASLGDYVKANFTPAMKDAAEAIKTLGTNATGARPGPITLEEALKDLGIQSAATTTQLVTDAKTAYDVVVASDKASQWEKDSALIKLLAAEEAAMKANGLAIPAEHQQMLDDLKTKTENTSTGLPATTSQFQQFGQQVSTVITNFAQDISKSLWDGDTSWGEKGKSLLKSLGQAVTSSFIEPATKAIGDFISTVIADLLSGKGFGGVLDTVKEIGSSISGAFKGGGGAADAAGGAGGAIPGGGAGAGGAGGGAGAAAGGLTGWIGAIGSAVTAISSVISNFQQAKMETTLNAIEHSTRYSELYLGSRGDGGILGILFKINEELAWGAQTKATESLRDLFKDWSGPVMAAIDEIKTQSWKLTSLNDAAYHSSVVLDQMLEGGRAESGMLERMLATVERIAVASERSVTYNLNGTDPSLVAGRMGQSLRLQGGAA